MKKIAFLVLVLFIFVLSGCTPSVKSEKEMKIDVQNYLNCFDPEEVWEIKKLTVTERKTSKKEEVDIVNVEIEATTEETEGIYSLVLNYKLYEQGWFFETAVPDENGRREVRPTKEPDQSIADKIMSYRDSKAVFKRKESFMDENKYAFYYEKRVEDRYAAIITEYSLMLKFNTYKFEWEESSVDEKEDFEWKILGSWRAVYHPTIMSDKQLYKNIVMDITKIEGNEITVKMYNDDTLYFNGTVPFDTREKKAKFPIEISGNKQHVTISPSHMYIDVGILGVGFERK